MKPQPCHIFISMPRNSPVSQQFFSQELVLDGKSKYDAQEWSDSGNLICFSHLVASSILIMLFQKKPVSFKHAQRVLGFQVSGWTTSGETFFAAFLKLRPSEPVRVPPIYMWIHVYMGQAGQ